MPPPPIPPAHISGLWELSMGVVSIATDHSTETTAKLLKANHPETDTLWILCVDLRVCVCVCLWSILGCVLLEIKRCFQTTLEAVAYTCLNWCSLRLNVCIP